MLQLLAPPGTNSLLQLLAYLEDSWVFAEMHCADRQERGASRWGGDWGEDLGGDQRGGDWIEEAGVDETAGWDGPWRGGSEDCVDQPDAGYPDGVEGDFVPERWHPERIAGECACRCDDY